MFDRIPSAVTKGHANEKDDIADASKKIQKHKSSICWGKVCSRIPSRMERFHILVADCGSVLKARFHTIVYTKPKENDEESVGSSYHVTINNEEYVEKEDAKDAPPEFEDDGESCLTRA